MDCWGSLIHLCGRGARISWLRLAQVATLAFLGHLLVHSLPAQSVSAADLGGSTALQNLPWRFSHGDNPEWKDPNFDDSAWPTVVPTLKPPPALACKGLCWYRLRLSVPPQSRDLSFGLNNVDTSYELFVNDQKVGGHGGMPPHASNYQSNFTIFPIPNAQVATGSLLVAIRLWVSPIVDTGDEPAGGMNPGSQILLGRTSDLELSREQDVANTTNQAFPRLLDGLLGLLVGIPALLLFRSQRDRREYLWLFGMGACLATEIFVHTAASFDHAPIPLDLLIFTVFIAMYFVCSIEFAFAFIRRPVSTLFRVLEWSYIPFALLCLLGEFILHSPPIVQIAFAIWQIPVDIGIPILLIFAYKRGNKEAGLLLIPVAFMTIGNYAYVVWNMLALLFPQGKLPPIPVLHLGPVSVNIAQLFSCLTSLTIGLIILQRNTAIERERVTAEMQAAKAVQDVLMPKLTTETPGFVLQSVYRPAQEVGGDFFHLLPGEDGSLRVVIGDVSGKGLKAAMTVALIVGALDRESSRRPAEVLKGLNHMLAQHSTGGFATCLCLHITPDGTLTAANAGHFAPFQNGRETTMEGNLPLGIDSQTEYLEATWPLHPGDRLLLFTDGVPEARNPSGVLFGFERTNSLIASANSAEEIATAAQAFGQDDDITVVELSMANYAA